MTSTLPRRRVDPPHAAADPTSRRGGWHRAAFVVLLGGILSSPTPGPAVTSLISGDASRYTWAAAAVTSNQAAGYQLATQLPVLAVGGFNGTDPYPSPAQFQQMVASGQIHGFVGPTDLGGFGGRRNADSGGSDAAGQIAAWVAATFPSRTVDGVTLYDLSSG